MRTICKAALALLVTLTSVPTTAQERWVHAASGTSLPKSFEAQSLVEQRDLGTPNDSAVNYEATSGNESTTIYIFKASVPNARLWFDRAIPVVTSQIPLAIFKAGAIEQVAAFGGTVPTAIRQIFVTDQAGPFKSTALVVAQSGPWIIKMRASSATLDRDGLTARIDRHLAAIRTAPPAFAAALQPPARCAAPPVFGSGKPVSERIERTAASAIVIHARMHMPDQRICLADNPNARFTLLGVADQPSSWVLLTGDAGKAIGAETLVPGQTDLSQLVYVSTPASTRGAAVFDAPSSLAMAAQAAAPLLRDPAAGLFAISSTTDPLASEKR